VRRQRSAYSPVPLPGDVREQSHSAAAVLDFAVAQGQDQVTSHWVLSWVCRVVPHDLTVSEVFAVAIPAVVEQDGDRAIAVQRGRVLFS